MERAPRFAGPLAIASALHLAALAGLWRTRPPVVNRPLLASEETVVDLVPEPVAPPPAEARSEAPRGAPAAPPEARSAKRIAAPRRGPVTAGPGEGDVAAEAAPAPAAGGVGEVAAPPPPSKPDALPPPLMPRAERAPSAVLAAPLAQRDAELGLGAGGQVIGVARAIADASAPQRGHGTISVEADATGSVRRVGSTSPGWEAFARELRAKLAGKRLRVPPGAQGVVVRLAVSADVTAAPSAITGETKAAPCRPPERERDQVGRVDRILDTGCLDWRSLAPLPRRRISVSLAGESAI